MVQYGFMIYNSPTHGKLDLESLKDIISAYMAQDKTATYDIIVGTDSQKTKSGNYDFVSALIVHRVGFGGIYFWNREVVTRKISLKERIYEEATRSLMTSEHFVSFFKSNGISKYKIQIHVDIGHNGQTRELITEVVGMIRGSGYEVRIKPDSFGASKVADRHT